MPGMFQRALEVTPDVVAGVAIAAPGDLITPSVVDPNDPSGTATFNAGYYGGVRIRLTAGGPGTITFRAFPAGVTGTPGDEEMHRADFVFTAAEGLSDVLEPVVPFYNAFSMRVVASVGGMTIEVIPIVYAGDIVRLVP